MIYFIFSKEVPLIDVFEFKPTTPKMPASNETTNVTVSTTTTSTNGSQIEETSIGLPSVEGTTAMDMLKNTEEASSMKSNSTTPKSQVVNNDENNCKTTLYDEDSPADSYGKPCIFPFMYVDKNMIPIIHTIDECTADFCGEKNCSKYWCSTKVDDDGVHIQGNWGYCNRNCSKHGDIEQPETIL